MGRGVWAAFGGVTQEEGSGLGLEILHVVLSLPIRLVLEPQLELHRLVSELHTATVTATATAGVNGRVTSRGKVRIQVAFQWVRIR